jgi:hypothetical protein
MNVTYLFPVYWRILEYVFLPFYLFLPLCFSSIRFMVEPLLIQGRQVGPASRTFYPPFSYSNGIDSSSQFREQLSDAYSRTYLLTRHAVVNSYFDCAPLTDYQDVQAYDEAASLYLTNSSPRDDLIFAKWSVYRARLINQRYRTRTCQLVRVLKRTEQL